MMSGGLWVVGQDGDAYPASETQLESFERAKETAATKRGQVLEVIRGLQWNLPQGGACVAEIAEVLGWDQHWVSPRVTELKQRNLVRDSGRTRWNAKSQREQTVWVAT